ncbi:MAG TPA: helix-turn-helix transcriptional regulator [Patescibacteria group bacterium]|nr:helix-turn-helix transcriptional regulator [Patescibacteria group bacterium]
MLNKTQFTKKAAKAVRGAREKRGISQEELAHRAGLYRTYIGHIENGRYSPSAYVLYKIAKALNTSVGELLNPL